MAQKVISGFGLEISPFGSSSFCTDMFFLEVFEN